MKNVHEPRKTNKQEWIFLSFSFIQNEEEKEIISCYMLVVKNSKFLELRTYILNPLAK